MANSGKYDSSSIVYLRGLEPVRQTPGMYIGTTSQKGLHHLAWEILDNSIDEGVAGFASQISITLLPDNWVTVSDDGRGIPVDIHPETQISTVETVLTKLHAGGKFNSETYKVSGGLHGVGASVVNALSSHLIATVYRDNKIYSIEFKNGGHRLEPLKEVGIYEGDKSGTTISFQPDFTIMDEGTFSYGDIRDRLKQWAYLNNNLTLTIIDAREEKRTESFHFEGGLVDYVRELNRSKKPLHPDIIFASGTTPSNEDNNNIEVQVAMQYTTLNSSSSIWSYANNINTHEGGQHEYGFNDALLRIINNFAIEKNFIKDNNDDRFKREDTREGLTAIISIKHSDPIFEGQTKSKLGNKDARQAVRDILSLNLKRFLDENPSQAELIINNVIIARKARLKALEAGNIERKKSLFNSSSLPGKLADCTTKNPTLSELYIVEGNSAGGSAKMGRDRETQAILPLRGKVINSEKNSTSKVLENEEIRTIIQALGTEIGETFDINKLRYHKIIIMTDADVDGAHIKTLLLTFFFKHFAPLIHYGFIYIAQPPLYKITSGKNFSYAYTDAERDEKIARLGEGARYSIQRYKGLGEMNPEQLWETTMDPQSRNMLQVQIDDVGTAHNVFSTLMGIEVAPRREFIEQNAKYVKNIDT